MAPVAGSQVRRRKKNRNVCVVSGKIACCKIMVIYDRFAASSPLPGYRVSTMGVENDETCDKIANEANLPGARIWRGGCF